MVSNNCSIVGEFFGAMEIEVSEKGYKSQKFYVNISDNPTRMNPCEFILRGDNCGLTNEVKKGQTVEVGFGLNGFKWEKDGKTGVKTSLQAYRVVLISREKLSVGPSEEPIAVADASSFVNNTLPSQSGTDDLPF